MDKTIQFCSNSDCSSYGHVGRGNIRIHSKKEQRYLCNECGHTFSETKGTAFYRLRHDEDHVSIMVSLIKHGCPPQAIVATYNHDERTVYSWLDRGGKHCKQVHEANIEQNQIDIKHIQADELCVTTVRLPGDVDGYGDGCWYAVMVRRRC